MKTQLSTEETGILNSVIHTVAFADHQRLQVVLRDAIKEINDTLPADKRKDDLALKQTQSEIQKNINRFLLEEGFYAEREGGVFFITEKGKHLKQQGSLQKYYDWKESRSTGLKKDLHTIKTRGYLDQDELDKAQKKGNQYKVRKFLLYPILGIIILMLVVGVAHHNGYDKSFPALKNWLDKK